MSDDLVSVAYVARRMGISTPTALKKLRDGTIPGYRVLYRYENRAGSHGKVERATFDAWWKRTVGNVSNFAKVGNAGTRR